MNICLLNDSFPPIIDGVSNTVQNYALELKRLGDCPSVVTPEYPGADDSAYCYPVLRYPGFDAREIIGYIAGYPFSPEVLHALEEEKVEILHSHCPVASTMLARALREQLKVPLVFTYHTKFDIDIENAIRGKLLQESAVRALVSNVEACDEVWVVSDGAGRNLKSLGYKGDYIVMENGVDVPRGRLDRERYMSLTDSYGFDLPDDLPLFLFVGRTMWYKGLRMMLDALKAIASGGMDFRTVIIGSGQDMEEVRSYVTELGLEDRVLFTGPVYDREMLSAWYCRANLFLFPSTFDTNGLVVREAAACSLPSVLIRGSCAAEGISDCRNGFTVDETPESLAVLLTRICMNFGSGDSSGFGSRRMLSTVGDCAANEIYISWADSVAKARRRYDTVIENYRSGVYKKHFRPDDEIFRLSGDLMDFFTNVKELVSPGEEDEVHL